MNDLYKAGEKSREEWESYLVSGQRDSVESILEFAKRVTEFKANCDKKQGGSTFAADVQAWNGLNQSSASRLLTIGKALPELMRRSHKLPNSENIIYDISLLAAESVNKKTGGINAFDAAIEADIIKPDVTGRLRLPGVPLFRFCVSSYRQ